MSSADSISPGSSQTLASVALDDVRLTLVDRRLLIVDDDDSVRRIVAELLTEEGYEPTTTAGAEEGIAQMRERCFPLVITDLKMPNRDGLWFLRELRREFPDTAIVMMTGYGQVDTAVEALRLGATDYLTKPIRANQLFTSVLRALDRRRLELENRAYQRGLEGVVQAKTQELAVAYEEISETYRITLEALVTALDARECETGYHSQRVVRFSLAIGEKLDLDARDMDDLARGALLHDIGKIGVPDQILLKPSQLTDDEWVEMRRHPEVGARILSGIAFLEPAAEIVLAHQERWDGKGYPRGLRGEEIPLGARIFAIADTFDAITTDRPYRRGQTIEHALDEIERHAGTQFDPRVVTAALQIGQEDWARLRREKPPFQTKLARPRGV